MSRSPMCIADRRQARRTTTDLLTWRKRDAARVPRRFVVYRFIVHPLQAFACSALALSLSCGAAPPPEVTSSARPAPPPTGAELQPFVDQLAHETAELRHLTLDRRVPVVVQTPDEINAEMRQELAAAHDDVETEQQVGIALGELPPDVHLAEVLSRFVGAEAQGYYDPVRERLVLAEADARALHEPNSPAGLDARGTIVHELVHALQHQHFAAQMEVRDAHTASFGDEARARLTLLEGDATVVAMDWAQRRRGGRLLGEPDMSARILRWTRDAQVLTEVNVPAYLVESAEQPYEAGANAVGVLHAAGGFARVDALLGRHALRTAEVFHPTRGDAVAWAEVPRAGSEAPTWRALALGEGELRLYLGLVMRTDRTERLAEAWRGDRFAWGSSARGLACRWEIACDTEANARAIVDGLRPLADRWRRDGCAGIAGATTGRCPAAIEVRGAHVLITRGDA